MNRHKSKEHRKNETTTTATRLLPGSKTDTDRDNDRLEPSYTTTSANPVPVSSTRANAVHVRPSHMIVRHVFRKMRKRVSETLCDLVTVSSTATTLAVKIVRWNKER